MTKNILNAAPRRLSDSIAIALIAFLAILFYLPLFRDLSHGIPRVDWCGIYPYIDFFRISIIKYHQFPLRIPHFCGGYPFIGFPYDISLSPLMLIVLVLGAIEGTKITVFLIVLCGALSVFYLTRYLLDYNLAGSVFSSVVFLFGSWGPCQYLVSNYEKLYFYFLPLLVVLLIKSTQNKKFIFFASVILAIVVISAGSIIIPIAIFLFLFACLHAIRFEKTNKIKVNIRYLTAFVLIMLITLFISMAKILPMHQLLARKDIPFVHFSYENDYSKIAATLVTTGRDVDPKKLYDWLFRADSFRFVKAGHFPSQYDYSTMGSFTVTPDRDDYIQMYFGYIPVLLAALGCFFYWKKVWRYLILLLISIMISFGPHSPVDLFKWLWHLHPYVHSIWRLDEYFTFQIFFLIAVISGRFFSFYLGERKKFLWLLIPVAIFSLNNMFWPNQRFLENRIHLRDRSEFSFQKDFFHVKIKNYVGWPEPYQVDQYYYLQSNIGLIDWLFGNLAIKTNVVPKYLVKEGDSRYLPAELNKLEANPAYRGEVFFQNEANQVQLQYFSPNKIRVRVHLQGADTLMINQNYHPSWRTNAGKLSNRGGLLAVVLDKPGDYMIQLTYVPLEFYRGFVISILSLLLAYYFMVYKVQTHAVCRDRKAV
jgi:hypothetical protein